MTVPIITICRLYEINRVTEQHDIKVDQQEFQRILCESYSIEEIMGAEEEITDWYPSLLPLISEIVDKKKYWESIGRCQYCGGEIKYENQNPMDKFHPVIEGYCVKGC